MTMHSSESLTDDIGTHTVLTEQVQAQLASSSGNSGNMEDYYRLQQNLLIFTVMLSGIIFFSVWLFYSLHIALNYLIGACTGVVYLRMLAKGVAELGHQRQRLGSGRLALFIGLIVVATQWQQLELIPAFLGFLTFKASLIGYTDRASMPRS